MENKRVTRRDFLVRMGALGLVGLGGSTLLSACGGQQQQQPAQQDMSGTTAEFSCMDVSGLTPEEIQMRESLQYTDHSPEPGKYCYNCQLYVPAPGPNQCGGCQLIKGPIHPNGYCTSWVQKVS